MAGYKKYNGLDSRPRYSSSERGLSRMASDTLGSILGTGRRRGGRRSTSVNLTYGLFDDPISEPYISTQHENRNPKNWTKTKKQDFWSDILAGLGIYFVSLLFFSPFLIFVFILDRAYFCILCCALLVWLFGQIIYEHFH